MLVKHLRRLQIVSYDTGVSRSELLKLTWDRVDLERGSFDVPRHEER